MTIDPVYAATAKEMIDWIGNELDRVRSTAISLLSPTLLAAYVSYVGDLVRKKEMIERFAHLRSERANIDQVRSFSIAGSITAEEILADLQRLQEEISTNSTEPAFQYYRSSLVQLEMDIHNIATTIAQSKLGENHDH